MTKSDDNQQSSDNKAAAPLHPAYSVSNIQSKIRTLDGASVTYSSWIKLFQFQAIAYRVVDHIDGTDPPNTNDPAYPIWKEIDALVSQWIYSTVSDDLLTRILDTSASARTTWLKLEKIFLSNKLAKAAALDTRFVSLTLADCSSVDDYCKQLKDLANQLADVDQHVTESRLVLKLIRGLSKEYDNIAALIQTQQADWDTARAILNDEVLRQASRQPDSASVLLTATGRTQTTAASQPPASQPPADSNNSSNHFQQPYRGRGRGRNNSYRGRGNRGRGYRNSNTGQSYGSQPPPGYPNYPQWAWWNTPPCPYPTQSNWRPNQQQYQPPQTQNIPAAHFTGFHSPQSYGSQPTGYDALSPSDLSQAFNTMQLNYTDPNAFMDTGAERHVTDNQGMIHFPDPFPVNTKLLVGNGQCLPVKATGTGP